MNIQIHAEVSENKTHQDSKITTWSHLSCREPWAGLWSSLLLEGQLWDWLGCSVLFPFGSRKLQRHRLHSLSGQPAPLSGCDSGWSLRLKKISSFILSEPRLFQLMLVVSHPPNVERCVEPSSIFSPTSQQEAPAGLHLCFMFSLLSSTALPLELLPMLPVPSLSHSSKLVHPRSRKLYLLFNFKTFLLAQSSSLPRSFQAHWMHSPVLFHLQT